MGSTEGNMLMIAHDRLLERLQVFAGSFDKRAALEVCADDELSGQTVEALLEQLCESGALRQVSDRYQLIEARPSARLDEPDLLPWRKAHAYWYLAFIEGLQDSGLGTQEATLEQIDAEHANIVRALDFSFAYRFDADLSLRLCIAAFRFWFIRGHFSEGIEYTLRSLSRVPGRQDDLKFKALSRAGSLLEATGDLERALVATRQARDSARDLGDMAAAAGAGGNLATILRDLGQLPEALTELGEAVNTLRGLNDDRKLVPALCNFAAMKIEAGDLEEVPDLLQECDNLVSVGRVEWAFSYLQFNYGEYYRASGMRAEATGRYREALLACNKLGDMRVREMVLRRLGELAAETQRFETAAKLFGAAEIARDQCHCAIPPVETNQAIVAISDVRAALGEDAFERAWHDGRDMEFSEASRLASLLN
ncbi:MAG: hypothetical protein WAO58_04890 [Fimbriimonadaceae bacterium]